jgi:hypothetical protein
MNQLTGAVTAGPGTGSQVASITNGAVTTAKIADGAVDNDKLAPEAVTTDKIAPLAVGTSNINDNAVEYGKMQGVVASDGAVLGAATTGPVVEIPFGAPARSIGAAGSVADVLDVLGIRDVGDFRNWAIAQAKQRLGLSRTQYPEVCIDEPFVVRAASAYVGNLYAQGVGSITPSNLTNLPGGWNRFVNAGGAEGHAIAQGFPNVFTGLTGGSVRPWYMAALIRVPDGASAETGDMQVGIRLKTDAFGDGPFMGAKGGSSDFFCVGTQLGGETNSTVEVDTNPHVLEWFGPLDEDGVPDLAGNFSGFSVDGTAVAVCDMGSGGFADACYPVIYVYGTNGEAVAKLDVGHLTAIVVPT